MEAVELQPALQIVLTPVKGEFPLCEKYRARDCCVGKGEEFFTW